MKAPLHFWDLICPKYDQIDRRNEGGIIDGDELAATLIEAVAPYRAVDDEYREKLQADLNQLDGQETVLVEELMYRETRLKEVRRSKTAIKAALDALAPEKKVADGYAGAA